MPIRAVHITTGEFLQGGFVTPLDPQYTLVTLPDDTFPDPRTQKWNGSAVVAMTAEEIAAYDAAVLTQIADVVAVPAARKTAREKDILTTCAIVVRERNTGAWNAMSLAQKVNATVTLANLWRDIRIAIGGQV